MGKGPKSHHVVPNPQGGWDVKRGGAGRASSHHGTKQEAIDRDELRVVAEALDELPERTRIAFEMHRMAGQSLQEVADHLGVSVTLVHQMVRKALVHCAQRLDACD